MLRDIAHQFEHSSGELRESGRSKVGLISVVSKTQRPSNRAELLFDLFARTRISSFVSDGSGNLSDARMCVAISRVCCISERQNCGQLRYIWQRRENDG